MSDYTLRTTVATSYDDALTRVREALADAGFGVLTEIDLKATLKAKLDVDVPPQMILGACRPPLAHAAILADPSIAALLPCNVVVRSEGDETVVEAFDPAAMVAIADNPALEEIASDARERLQRALEAVSGTD